MNTKKKVILIALVVGLAFTGYQQAFAKGGKNGAAPGQGPGIACKGGQPPQMMDEATKKKMDVFFKDTKEIRKDLAMKRAEKRAIFMSEKVDPKAAAKVEGELFDLRDAMRQKAEAAGLPFLGGMGGNGPGCGMMSGMMGPDGHKGHGNKGPQGHHGNRGPQQPPQGPDAPQQGDMGADE